MVDLLHSVRSSGKKNFRLILDKVTACHLVGLGDAGRKGYH